VDHGDDDGDGPDLGDDGHGEASPYAKEERWCVTSHFLKTWLDQSFALLFWGKLKISIHMIA
jgi:hypothetical protein